MKVVVKPFDLIYEHDKATGTVYLYGLIHSRSVHQAVCGISHALSVSARAARANQL